MVSLTSIVADFRSFIAASLPQIISLLEDDDMNARYASVNLLSKLSEHGM